MGFAHPKPCRWKERGGLCWGGGAAGNPSVHPVLVTPVLTSNLPILKCPAASQGCAPPRSSQHSPKQPEGFPMGQEGTGKLGAPRLGHPELLRRSLPTPRNRANLHYTDGKGEIKLD